MVVAVPVPAQEGEAQVDAGPRLAGVAAQRRAVVRGGGVVVAPDQGEVAGQGVGAGLVGGVADGAAGLLPGVVPAGREPPQRPGQPESRGPGARREPDGLLGRRDRLGVAAETFQSEARQAMPPLAVRITIHRLTSGLQRLFGPVAA